MGNRRGRGNREVRTRLGGARVRLERKVEWGRKEGREGRVC